MTMRVLCRTCPRPSMTVLAAMTMGFSCACAAPARDKAHRITAASRAIRILSHPKKTGVITAGATESTEKKLRESGKLAHSMKDSVTDSHIVSRLDNS